MKKGKKLAILLSVILLLGISGALWFVLGPSDVGRPIDSPLDSPLGTEVSQAQSSDIYNNGFSEDTSSCQFYEADSGTFILLPLGKSGGCGPVVFEYIEAAVKRDMSFTVGPVYELCVRITRYESSGKWGYRVGVRDLSDNWYVCDVSLLTDYCEIDRSSATSFDQIGLRTKSRVVGSIGGISNLHIYKRLLPSGCP